MNHTPPKIGRCLMLVLLVFLAAASASLAVIAPDITSLSSISSALSTPVRLAEDSAGALYVSDPRSGAIVKFDSVGAYQSKIVATADSLGVAVTASGNLLVSQGASVAVYSSAGTKLSQFGTFGKANGIAVTKTGDIFVVDSLKNNVQVFNSSFAPVLIGATNSFGSAGSAAGQFFQPTGISYEKVSDQLAVADTRNGRVQFFSTTGIYQKSIGSFGSGPLKFTSPQSISFEYSPDQTTLKRIYVVDAFQSTIQIIDGASDTFVRYIGSYGITDGKLIAPSDILFNKGSQLVVANGVGKLSLFKIADAVYGPMLQIDALPQATNTATLVLSGTTTGNTVTINGIPAQLSGAAWSGTVNLVVGVNTFVVAAADAKGTTTKSVTVTALTPEPNPVTLTVAPVTAQTADPVVKISGTITAGGSVTLSNGSNTINATVTGTSWSATTTLIAGANTLRIIGSKTGMGSSTLDVSVTLDTSMPVVATGLPSTGSTFSAPLQTLSGKVSNNTNAVTVIITVNGAPLPPVSVSDGLFSVPVILAQGPNSVTLSVVDSFGATIKALASSITYDPQAPIVTVSTPVGTVSSSATYHLAGVAPAGSVVTVNGAAAVQSGTGWSADVPLTQGRNSFEVKATPATGGAATTTMTMVSYAPGLPSLSITSPAKDAPVATTSYTITGSAPAKSIVTALVNGVPTSVAVDANTGAFSVTIPTMTAAAGSTASYAVTVSVTDPISGATSTSTRSVVYDPNPPVLTTVSASPSTIKVSAPGGALSAKDKNGPVGTIVYVNGIPTLDLTGVTYDPSTLNIQAFSAAGLSSRDGDLNLDGKVDIADALEALKVLAGLAPHPSFNQLLHGDVGPIINGAPSVDSHIRMSDIVVMIEKIIGLTSW
ncbi:MAG TPA: hypothetical protein HPP94_13080 [Desulfuromonadales bacterium]|nr:hypothetical protein [Desulfuromonadales bacterium]